MPVTIGNGTLANGGAIVTTSVGDKVAIYINSNVIYVDKDVDGTPTNVDSDTAATAFGGSNFGWIHAAIDGNDDIHVIAACDAEQTRDVSYAVCDLTTGFGAWEQAANYTEQAPATPGCSISLDSSDIPHILFVDAVKTQGTTQDNVYYNNRSGGTWSDLTQIGARANKADSYNSPTITLRNNDDIEAVSRGDTTANAHITAYNTYTGGSWVGESIYDVTVGGYPGFSGVISTVGGTVYRIHNEGTDIYENNVDTGADTTSSTNRASAVLADSTRYIFFIDASWDVHLYSNNGGGWSDEGALQTGTYTAVIAEWAYNNENQSNELSYIFDDGTDVFYDSFALAAPLSVSVNTLEISSSIQDITLSPAAASQTLDTLELLSFAQDIKAITPQTVAVDTLTITSQIENVEISIPLAVSINTLILNSQIEDIAVVAGAVSQTLDTLVLNSTIEDLLVSPGAASFTLDTLLLSSYMDDTSIVATIGLDTLELSGVVEDIDVLPGAISQALDTLQILSNLQDLAVSPGVASVLADTLVLLGSVENISIAIGASTIFLDTLELSTSLENIVVSPGTVSIQVDSLIVTSQIEDLDVVTVGALTVILNSLELASSIVDVTISPGAVTLTLDTLELLSNAQDLDILLGAVSVLLNSLSVTSGIEDIAISPGATSILLDALLLQSDIQNVIVTPGAVTTSLGTLELESFVDDIAISIAAPGVLLDTLSLQSQPVSLAIAPAGVSISLDSLELSSIVIDTLISLVGISYPGTVVISDADVGTVSILDYENS